MASVARVAGRSDRLRDRRRDRGREVAREEEALGRLVAAHPRGVHPQRVSVGLEELLDGLALLVDLVDRPRGEVGPVGAYGDGAHLRAVSEGVRHVDGRKGRELLVAGPARAPRPAPGLRLAPGRPGVVGPLDARAGVGELVVAGLSVEVDVDVEALLRQRHAADPAPVVREGVVPAGGPRRDPAPREPVAPPQWHDVGEPQLREQREVPLGGEALVGDGQAVGAGEAGLGEEVGEGRHVGGAAGVALVVGGHRPVGADRERVYEVGLRAEARLGVKGVLGEVGAPRRGEYPVAVEEQGQPSAARDSRM